MTPIEMPPTYTGFPPLTLTVTSSSLLPPLGLWEEEMERCLMFNWKCYARFLWSTASVSLLTSSLIFSFSLRENSVSCLFIAFLAVWSSASVQSSSLTAPLLFCTVTWACWRICHKQINSHQCFVPSELDRPAPQVLLESLLFIIHQIWAPRCVSATEISYTE